ncbi:MAG: hypothetical protein N2C12_12305, partial [Planctomycetales bacterium]
AGLEDELDYHVTEIEGDLVAPETDSFPSAGPAPGPGLGVEQPILETGPVDLEELQILIEEYDGLESDNVVLLAPDMLIGSDDDADTDLQIGTGFDSPEQTPALEIDPVTPEPETILQPWQHPTIPVQQQEVRQLISLLQQISSTQQAW